MGISSAEGNPLDGIVKITILFQHSLHLLSVYFCRPLMTRWSQGNFQNYISMYIWLVNRLVRSWFGSINSWRHPVYGMNIFGNSIYFHGTRPPILNPRIPVLDLHPHTAARCRYMRVNQLSWPIVLGDLTSFAGNLCANTIRTRARN